MTAQVIRLSGTRLRLGLAAAAAWLAVSVLAVMAALTMPALATTQADPPGRIGRLSEVAGNVWLYDDEDREWRNASLNRPVTGDDRLSTDAGARAEIRIGSTTLRLGENTEIAFERLDDGAVRVLLDRGSLAARLRSQDSAAEFEVITREARLRPLRTGHYRVDRDDGRTEATAWDGRLEASAGAGRFDVEPGRRLEIAADRSGVVQARWIEPVYDAFAGWARSDSWIDENGATARYVSPEMTGVEDLDRYGRWIAESDDGPLWVPTRVEAGWAPYQDGHWAWVNPWGWTWVDAAPWGFAPFHYGRWVWHRNSWCWAPGRYVRRPVYAPALVAWVGDRDHRGPPGSRGLPPRVGWFPLGPREAYVPDYRHSPGYVRDLNGAWHRDGAAPRPAGEHYVNRNVPGAVTLVPREVVERREPVGPAWRDLRDRVGVLPGAGVGAVGAAGALMPGLVTLPRAPVDPRRGSDGRGGREPGRVVRDPRDDDRAPVRRPPADAPRVAVQPNAGDENAIHYNQMPGVPRPADEPELRPRRPPVRDDEPPRNVRAPRRDDEPAVRLVPREVERPRAAEPPREVERSRAVEPPREIERAREADRPRPVERPRAVEPRDADVGRAAARPVPAPSAGRRDDGPSRADNPPRGRDGDNRDDLRRLHPRQSDR